MYEICSPRDEANGEKLDILSTRKSVYGYLAITDGLNFKKFWNSYSVNSKANIGPNNGKKFSINDKIFIKNPT